ncbi:MULTISPECIES: hypothetical protein [unclassified Hydrogenophaga]|uniref:hypothetical protein n=1 Tax=unclassified Hydrogenophaga TaxID=2610897 RepID=UPI002613AF19|nr:hypothetical protein [Hydrogenophaga sp.]MCW5671176.1 hypothetical protein [Hydrogenophaga sp.]
MFKKLLFRIALNTALRELGIQTTALNPQFRNEVVDLVTKNGLSPKEAAIGIYAVIADRMNVIDRMAAQDVVREWRLRPEVRETNFQLALHGQFLASQTPPLREH